jgi:hypothetical protein
MDTPKAEILNLLSTPEQTLALAELALDYPGGAELGAGTALLFFPLSVRELERIANGEG